MVLIMDLEDQFNLQVEDSAITTLKPCDVVDYIQSRQGAGKAELPHKRVTTPPHEAADLRPSGKPSYHFKDINLLKTALTHTTVCQSHNQRLGSVPCRSWSS